MTSTEHIDLLERPDPARDSGADRILAAIAENQNFEFDYAREYGFYHHELPSAVKLLRDVAETLRDDARPVFASNPGNELEFSNSFYDESMPWGYTAPLPDYAPTDPPATPVALFRRDKVIRSARFDLVAGQAISQPAVTSAGIERHYAFGTRRLPDIAADALHYARAERGCDLRLFAGGGQLHDSLTRQSSRFIWPIACGETLVILRYCSECLGTLFSDLKIGESTIGRPLKLG